MEGDPEAGMLVRKIEEGTVIDHIPDWRSGLVAQVLRLSRLAKLQADVSVAILQNVASRQLVRKDMIKIDRWHVDEGEADILCLIFPSITINYIKEWKVTKYKPKVPDIIEGRIKCPEVQCISNAEREPISPEFATWKKNRILQCGYCDTLLPFDRIPDYVKS